MVYTGDINRVVQLEGSHPCAVGLANRSRCPIAGPGQAGYLLGAESTSTTVQPEQPRSRLGRDGIDPAALNRDGEAPPHDTPSSALLSKAARAARFMSWG